VAALPEPETNLVCEACGNRVTEDATVCPHCGDLFEQGLQCEAHPGSEAISRCVVCGRLLCKRCEEKIAGRSFCPTHNAYRFVENWAVVYTADAEWNASLLEGYLRDNGVECVVDSKRDSARALTVGHFAQVNVMVPFDRVLEAERLIADWDDGSDPS
jgi:RNA polymerase subunit RPABC4/transcription elongation factor Spt4